jgi:hypothetical protein
MSQYIIQASPLTRIRLPEWHLKCLNNPELISSPEPFDVVIPRTLGAVKLRHKQVTLASTLIPRIKNRAAEEDEVAPLVRWLTSPHETETDIWGVVALKLDHDVADQIIGLILNHGGKDSKVKKSIEEVQQGLIKSFQASQKEADELVIRALSKLYNVVKQTRDFMKKNNMGVYSPSFAEGLAIHVVNDSVKQREIADQQAARLMMQAFDVQGATANG